MDDSTIKLHFTLETTNENKNQNYIVGDVAWGVYKWPLVLMFPNSTKPHFSLP